MPSTSAVTTVVDAPPLRSRAAVDALRTSGAPRGRRRDDTAARDRLDRPVRGMLGAKLAGNGAIGPTPPVSGDDDATAMPSSALNRRGGWVIVSGGRVVPAIDQRQPCSP